MSSTTKETMSSTTKESSSDPSSHSSSSSLQKQAATTSIVRLIVISLVMLWIILSPLRSVYFFTGDSTLLQARHVIYYPSRNASTGGVILGSTGRATTADGVEEADDKLRCLPTDGTLNDVRVIVYDRGCLPVVKTLYSYCGDMSITASTSCYFLYDKGVFDVPRSKLEEERGDINRDVIDDSVPVITTFETVTALYSIFMQTFLRSSCSSDEEGGLCPPSLLNTECQAIAANARVQLRETISLARELANEGYPHYRRSAALEAFDRTDYTLMFPLMSNWLCRDDVCFSNGANNSFVMSLAATTTLTTGIPDVEKVAEAFCSENTDYFPPDVCTAPLEVGTNFSFAVTKFSAKGFLDMHDCLVNGDLQLLEELMAAKSSDSNTYRRIPREIAIYMQCPLLRAAMLDDLEYFTPISAQLDLTVKQLSTSKIGSLAEDTVTIQYSQVGLSAASKVKAKKIQTGSMKAGREGDIYFLLQLCFFLPPFDDLYLHDTSIPRPDSSYFWPPEMIPAIQNCLQRRWKDANTFYFASKVKAYEQVTLHGRENSTSPKKKAVILLLDPQAAAVVRQQLTSEELETGAGGQEKQVAETSTYTKRFSFMRWLTRTGTPATGPEADMIVDSFMAVMANISGWEANGAVNWDQSTFPYLLTLNSSWRHLNISSRFSTGNNTILHLSSCNRGDCAGYDTTVQRILDGSFVGFAQEEGNVFFRPPTSSDLSRWDNFWKDPTRKKNTFLILQVGINACDLIDQDSRYYFIRPVGVPGGFTYEAQAVANSDLFGTKQQYQQACFLQRYLTITKVNVSGMGISGSCQYRHMQGAFLDPFECADVAGAGPPEGTIRRINVFADSFGSSVIPLESNVVASTVLTVSNGLRSYDNGVIYVALIMGLIYVFRITRDITKRIRIVARILSALETSGDRLHSILYFNEFLLEFIDCTEREMAKMGTIEKLIVTVPSMVVLARAIRPISLLNDGMIVGDDYFILSTDVILANISLSDALILIMSSMTIGGVLTANRFMRGISATTRLLRWTKATFRALLLVLSSSGLCVLADRLPEVIRAKIEVGLAAVCLSVCTSLVLTTLQDQESVLVTIPCPMANSGGQILQTLGFGSQVTLSPSLLLVTQEDEEKVNSKSVDEEENPEEKKTRSIRRKESYLLNVYWVVNHILTLCELNGGTRLSSNAAPTLGSKTSSFAVLIYAPGQLRVKMMIRRPEGVRLGILPSGTALYFDSYRLSELAVMDSSEPKTAVADVRHAQQSSDTSTPEDKAADHHHRKTLSRKAILQGFIG